MLGVLKIDCLVINRRYFDLHFGEWSREVPNGIKAKCNSSQGVVIVRSSSGFTISLRSRKSGIQRNALDSRGELVDSWSSRFLFQPGRLSPPISSAFYIRPLFHLVLYISIQPYDLSHLHLPLIFSETLSHFPSHPICLPFSHFDMSSIPVSFSLVSFLFFFIHVSVSQFRLSPRMYACACALAVARYASGIRNVFPVNSIAVKLELIFTLFFHLLGKRFESSFFFSIG